jgi:cyclic pyranopterin phosphate synthase
MRKGDVLAVAQLAGIGAAKRTAELIPLCHNIPIDRVEVRCKVLEAAVEIRTEAVCTARTGIEMEALTAAAVAALTVYDMCKALTHGIMIREVTLLAKSGGKRDYVAQGERASR